MLLDELKWRRWSYKNNVLELSPDWPVKNINYAEDEDFCYMSFTGLYGHDGKEIWEGDILFYIAYQNELQNKDIKRFRYQDEWFLYRLYVDYDPINGYVVRVGDKGFWKLIEIDRKRCFIVGNGFFDEKLLRAKICEKCFKLKIKNTKNLYCTCDAKKDSPKMEIVK